ncbi:ABC transporter substrate-binding protein [Mesorhizobium sp. INR15]|nr:ABC transporter substrate-binding protein [Mesorhizobium sp. INR15]
MKNSRFQLVTSTALCLLLVVAQSSATRADIRIGSLSALTGPAADLVKQVFAAEQAAIDEINSAGGVLGQQVTLIPADTACNAQVGVDAANKLVNVEQVAAIIGGTCSGETIPAASNVAGPAGVLMVSPVSTSPEITKLDDKGVLFRVVPSDNFQGIFMARLLLSKGITKVALTYVNNDYGVGLAEAFRKAYLAGGGKIAGDSVHEDKKESYRAELATLASGGAQTLVLFAIGDSSGLTIMRQSLESGLFEKFAVADGMKVSALLDGIGAENLEGRIIGSVPTGAIGPQSDRFKELYGHTDKFTFGYTFTAQGYDAAMITALAIEKAGSTDRRAIVNAVRDVTNAPGEIVGPGDWAKAVELIKAGKDINYSGAAGDHEFDENGDVAGVFSEWTIKAGAVVVSAPVALEK